VAAPIEKCWVCGTSPAPWTILAERKGEPTLQVVFSACEKCVPFERKPLEPAPKV
jgi:hypothetical protein